MAVGSHEHDADLVAVMHAQLPTWSCVPQVRVGRRGASRIKLGLPVAAMIETAAAVLAAPDDRAAGCDALIAGTNDLSATCACRAMRTARRWPMALQAILIAARAAGIAVFDGVYNRLDDPDGFARRSAREPEPRL